MPTAASVISCHSPLPVKCMVLTMRAGPAGKPHEKPSLSTESSASRFSHILYKIEFSMSRTFERGRCSPKVRLLPSCQEKSSPFLRNGLCSGTLGGRPIQRSQTPRKEADSDNGPALAWCLTSSHAPPKFLSTGQYQSQAEVREHRKVCRKTPVVYPIDTWSTNVVHI